MISSDAGSDIFAVNVLKVVPVLGGNADGVRVPSQWTSHYLRSP